MSARVLAGPVVVALVCLGALPASAQPFETLGTRALGMGGAFVAIADDVSSVYWNPAGQVGGSLAAIGFDLASIESGPREDSRKEGGAGPADRRSSQLLGVITPPIGFGYYRLETLSSDGRTESGPVDVTRVVTNTVAVTVGQTLGSLVALGASVKAVNGGFAPASVPAGADPLDRADDLDVDSSAHFDLDLGAMLTVGRLRLGVVGRNLLAPDLQGPDGARLELRRQGRVGVAITASDRIVLALDADLTRVTASGGDRRNVAVGAESWWAKRRIGVRGGLRASTLGEARPVGAIGASVGLTTGLYVDAQATRGEDLGERGWGFALAARYGF